MKNIIRRQFSNANEQVKFLKNSWRNSIQLHCIVKAPKQLFGWMPSGGLPRKHVYSTRRRL